MMLEKDDAEHQLPENWRSIVRSVVDAFVDGDFELRDHSIGCVTPIDGTTAKSIADNISAYGDELVPLGEGVWETSIYRWMDGHWQLLVNLSTKSEPVSDLALHARIYEDRDLRLEIDSVHVP